MRARTFFIWVWILIIFFITLSLSNIYHAIIKPSEISQIATVLRLASNADEHHLNTETARHFADMVAERSDGRIRIQVVSGRALGDETATLEQLSFGGLAFLIVNSFAMPDNLLVLSNDKSGLAINPHTLKMNRMELLGSFASDMRCIASTEKLDLDAGFPQNATIGAYDSSILAATLEALGFIVKPCDIHDLGGTVRYGQHEHVEVPLLCYLTENHWRFMPHIFFYKGLAAADILLASQVSIGNLSAEDQMIIRECAQEATQFQHSKLRSEQKNAIDQLIKKGVSFTGNDHYGFVLPTNGGPTADE